VRRIALLGVFSLLVQSAGSLPAWAQSATASLTVSASVTKNCTITTAPVAFGNYDSVAANATTPLDGIGTLTVTCTKGAAAQIALNPGNNADGQTRRMSQGGAEYLRYDLYSDPNRQVIWGIGNNDLDIPAAPNRNPRNFTVYGRVPQAQDATVGNYTDTVVATVNF
jgi:spore coat protein U-like protein